MNWKKWSRELFRHEGFRTFGEAMMRMLVNEIADARPRLIAIGEATAAADFLQLWMDFLSLAHDMSGLGSARSVR